MGFSQKEANFWYFGKKVGLDFSQGSPAVLTNSGMEASYSTATISDQTTGELLFYTNGIDVWNRDHEIMPNGRGVIPDSGKLIPANRVNYISQGALIVPFPEDSDKYYLFTLGLAVPMWTTWYFYDGVITALYYSVIDMRLNGGKGDVVPDQKRVFVADGFTERLTGIIHSNGRDYWIINHEWANNVFQVRQLTPDGLTEAKRIAVGPTVPFNLQDTIGLTEEGRFKGNFESVGVLRASPDGKKLANSSAGKGHVSLFDFDPATGNITNPIDLGSFIFALALSFSPDNSKLYVQNSRQNAPNKRTANLISQYDLEAGDAAAIIASGRSIIQGNPTTNIDTTVAGAIPEFNLQIGLDGRIYGNSNVQYWEKPNEKDQERMFVINAPNEAGFACDVQFKNFYFGKSLLPESPVPIVGESYSWGALPNFLQHYFNGLEPIPIDEEPTGCDPDQAITIFPNPTFGTFKIAIKPDCYQIDSAILYTISGQKIGELEAKDLTGEIDISTLSAGMYLLELSAGTRQIVKKIMKL